MHAVATSPDDLFFWDCRSGRYEKRPERLLQRSRGEAAGCSEEKRGALAIGLTPRTASSEMRNVRTRHATPVVPALALRIAESSGNIFGNGK